MSTWEVLEVDVLELRLDPRNVRLELTDDAPESDIVHDLFVNEKAFSLVESIIKVGLLTHEVPIVLERDGDLVVVEGNRRVAALKAIQNPYLVPSHQARINKLVEGSALRDSLRRIEVKKAPSQDDADQLIAALHTGNQRVAWSPARQAAFFQAQIDSGKTAEDLFRLYPTVDVKKFISRSQVLNLLRSVDYDDPALKDFVKSRRFPVSTLARLYENDKFLELVGIRVNNTDGTVTLEADKKHFAMVAERIVGGIHAKELDTRSLNTTKSAKYKLLMDDLRDIMNEEVVEDEKRKRPEPAPDTKASSGRQGFSGNGKSAHTAGPSNDASQANRQGEAESGSDRVEQPAAAKPPSKQRNYLDTDEFTVPPNYPRAIHQIMKELSGLRIDRFPNAALDLMRTFLEKSIKAYAESKGEDIRVSLNAAAMTGGSGAAGTPVKFVQLGECLLWLEKHFQNSGPTALRQVVAKIRAGKVADYIASADHLNAINHNHHVFATTTDVRECWETMQGVLRAILA